jgi:hypothetical protein
MSAPLLVQMAKGEDVIYSCTHQQSQSNAAPMDITGWTISVTIKDQMGNIALTKPGTLITPTSGQYNWSLVSADTLNLRSGTYLIDIWRIDPGSKRQMGYGSFIIAADALFGS